MYILKDPETQHIRYVGYTKRPRVRLWEHIRDAKKGINTHKSNWIRTILLKSLSPIIEIILEKDNQYDIITEEINLIKELKESGVKLTNKTDGGDGQRGCKLKSDHPIINWNKGRKMSDESKMKLSESRKGITFTESHKKNISESKIGKKRSEESIMRQSQTMSEGVIVITPDGILIEFSKIVDAVKFTGVNSSQIKKLIKSNKKSRKGFLFKK